MTGEKHFINNRLLYKKLNNFQNKIISCDNLITETKYPTKHEIPSSCLVCCCGIHVSISNTVFQILSNICHAFTVSYIFHLIHSHQGEANKDYLIGYLKSLDTGVNEAELKYLLYYLFRFIFSNSNHLI